MFYSIMMTIDSLDDIKQMPSFFEKLWQAFLDYLPTLLIAVLLYFAGCFINKLIVKLIGRGLEKSKLDKTVHGFISSLVKIILFALILIIVLTVLGIPMTSIIAVVGSAGLAIGLAMQSSLSNVAGGLVVLVGKQFKVGDYVEINGMSGTVSSITILSTKLLMPDNKVVYIPNGAVSNSTITNYTQEKMRRVDWVFGISYNNDVNEAIEVIKGVAAENDKILKSPVPFVHINSFGASSVDIVTRVWVLSDDYWDVYFQMMEDIKKAFDENGIIIPYNQLDVHMVEKK